MYNFRPATFRLVMGLALAAMSACTAVPAPTTDVPPVETLVEPPAAPAPKPTTDVVVAYLTLAGKLAIAGNRTARDSILTALHDDVRAAPTPSNRLRLAVGQAFVQLAPEDLAKARHALNQLVVENELPALERRIAAICLDLMERQRRFQDRIATLEGQIDALTAIEQRIRDQGIAQ